MVSFPWKCVHFVGIGGAGMSGMALILQDSESTDVTGSDQSYGTHCRTIVQQGGSVFKGHCANHLPSEADAVVFSNAVPSTNPEIAEARRLGVPVYRRGEFLARMAACYPMVIGVTGSHGKTTTTAMITHLLQEAGLRPGYLIGGDVATWPSPAACGNGQCLVLELDESDGTQALIDCTYGVILNIEDDHCWNFGGKENFDACFLQFAARSEHLIVWDEPGTRKFFEDHSLAEKQQIRWLHEKDLPTTEVTSIEGRHNWINAAVSVAAVAEATGRSVSFPDALSNFPGVERRLSLRYKDTSEHCVLIEDYAHHPTELDQTLQAVKGSYPSHAVTLVFQPHRFERVRRFAEAFAQVMETADNVVVTEPFAAWEPNNENADITEIVERMPTDKVESWNGSYDGLAETLIENAARANSSVVILIVGAGDITELASTVQTRLISKRLQKRKKVLAEEVPNAYVSQNTTWSELTSLGVGRSSPLLFSPVSFEDLANGLKLLTQHGIDVLPLGNGTNIVGSDHIEPRAVICPAGGTFDSLEVDPQRLYAGANVSWAHAMRAAVNAGILPKKAVAVAGVPGTVGGTVHTNAGAHGVTVGDFVHYLYGVRSDGRRWEAYGNEIAWTYRGTSIPSDVIIAAVSFKFQTEAPPATLEDLQQEWEARKARQPQGATAGCMFKNAGDAPAGKLIDKAGCKNKRIGGCQIADEHANFFLCNAEVQESDIIDLMTYARKRVLDLTGIDLVPEVHFANQASERDFARASTPFHTVVLHGGISSEREVSLVSGNAVAEALQKAGHLVHKIDVNEASLPELPPDTDVVFPVLHGTFGEDGGIQQLLEQAGANYVGADSHASALIMDKGRTKSRLEEHGINTPESEVFKNKSQVPAFTTLAPPVVVKPACQGSTMGLTCIETPDETLWQQAVAKAFAMDDQIMVEQKISGTELTVAVLDGEALPTLEIVPPEGRIFDYDAKYEHKHGDTQYLCPPEHISTSVQQTAQRVAVDVFRLLEARDLLRVDFILDKNEKLWVLEANTIPGFTPSSLFPMAAQAAGLSFVELCAKLINNVYTRDKTG